MVECLRLMNMERYVDVFCENQICGDLLSSLDEDMMKKDLGISAMHARKLYMFARLGWRPDCVTRDLETHTTL